jgi:hypothetical protein
MVAATALAVVAAVGQAAASAAPAASPWTQTNYDSAQSRANLTEKALTATTVGKVRYLRSVATPLDQPSQRGCTSNTFAAPVLAGGSLYVVGNDRVTRYNAATGAVIWRKHASAGLDATSLDALALTVAKGLVLVGQYGCGSASDPNGYVQAYKASTGALVWSKPISSLGGALDQMVVSGDYVVAAGTSPGGGQVVAVRRLTTGARVWSRLDQECAPGAVLVIAGLVVSYACSGGESLTANHLVSGAVAWSRAGAWVLQRGELNASTGGHLYATNPSGAVVDLNPVSGKTRHTLQGATTVLAVDGSRAYADCGGLGVCAYRIATGGRAWNAQPGSAPTLAAEAGGVLYLDQGQTLNAATGANLTSLWVGTASALAIGDGRIAVVTDPRVLDLYGLPGS